MNNLKSNVLYNLSSRLFFKQISVHRSVKNVPDPPIALTPKQIAKLAVDVPRCANTDIKVWDSFREHAVKSLDRFDHKDVLRVFEGLNGFYAHLDYEIRQKDSDFINLVSNRLFDCVDSYSCSRLSKIAQMLSNFASNSSIDPSKLFSKIALLFKIRLAEATSSDVTSLLASFSTVGIYDKSLTDTLVQLALKTNFTRDELRSISVSCALLDHHDAALLTRLCDVYHNSKDLSLNELAILSFIFSKCSFKSERVISLFQRGLKQIDYSGSSNGCDNDFGYYGSLNGIDMPNLSLNLHNIGVAVPEDLINRIDFKTIQPNLLIEMLGLFSLYPFKQDSIVDRCKEIERSVNDNVQILEYLSKGPFTKKSRELFNIIVRSGGERVIGGLFNEGDGLRKELLVNEFNELVDDFILKVPTNSLLDLPVTWFLEERLYNVEATDEGSMKKMLYIRAAIVAYIRNFVDNDGIGTDPVYKNGISNPTANITGNNRSPINVNSSVYNTDLSLLIDNIESKMDKLAAKMPLLDTLLDVVSIETPLPRILIRECEGLLNKEIKETLIHEGLKVLLVEGTRNVILPIYPNDLIQVKEDRVEWDITGNMSDRASKSKEEYKNVYDNEFDVNMMGRDGNSFTELPLYTLPGMKLLIKMYIISKLDYRVIPISYHEWNGLENDQKLRKLNRHTPQ